MSEQTKHPNNLAGDDGLMAGVASHCDAASWAQFVPSLAHMNLGPALYAMGASKLSPGLWALWLSQARPSAQVPARRLLMLMTRHRWRVEVAPPSPNRGASAERLRALISVQGHAWVATLAVVPHVHVMALQAMPEVHG
jgi:hypothetical protein